MSCWWINKTSSFGCYRYTRYYDTYSITRRARTRVELKCLLAEQWVLFWIYFCKPGRYRRQWRQNCPENGMSYHIRSTLRTVSLFQSVSTTRDSNTRWFYFHNEQSSIRKLIFTRGTAFQRINRFLWWGLQM